MIKDDDQVLLKEEKTANIICDDW